MKYDPDSFPQNTFEGFHADAAKFADSIFQRLNAFVFVFDIQDLKILWVNDYLAEKLCYSARDIISMDFCRLMEMVHPDFHEELTHKGKENSKAVNILRLRTRTGRWCWVIGCFNYISERLIIAFGQEIEFDQLTKTLKKIEHQELHIKKDNIMQILSCRQLTVLKLIAKGNTDREIAENLNISIHTAKTHRKNIIHKLGFKNSGTLINFAVENHLD